MHRNRTWLLDPIELRTQRNRILPIEGGDGATISLDFTTGVLDSRLTFTRLSDATFINSSGFVQYADANYIRNSVFSGSETPTGWGLVVGGAGLTIPSDGVRRAITTTPATQNFINSAALSTVVGQVYATTANIREVSGQHYRNTLEVTASPTILKYYRNGVEVASGASGQFNTAEAGLITVVWIATSATAHLVRLGVGCTGANVANAVCEFERPHLTPVFFSGTTPANSPSTYTAPAYVPNTNTGAAYQAPRFDHDPTTGSPRGLLIEGAATNLCLRSEDFGNAVWQPDNSGATNPVVSTVSQTAPNGASSVNRVTLNKTGGTFSRLYQAITGTAGQTYTLSVWMKANTANGGAATQNVGLRIGGSNGVNCVVTTTWQRFTHPAFAITGTDANFQLLLWDNIPANDETADVLVWGAQVELGSGASSYIPTGASTGNRQQDLVSITTTNFSSWWTSNNPASFLVDISSTNRPLANHIFRIADSSGSAYGYQSYFNSTTMPMQVRAAMSSTASSDIAIGSNLAANTRTKIGFTVETASLKRFRDGSLAHTLATPTLPPNTLTQMYIGGTSSFGNASADFHIKQFKYWPVTLSDAAMQGFTT